MPLAAWLPGRMTRRGTTLPEEAGDMCLRDSPLGMNEVSHRGRERQFVPTISPGFHPGLSRGTFRFRFRFPFLHPSSVKDHVPEGTDDTTHGDRDSSTRNRHKLLAVNKL